MKTLSLARRIVKLIDNESGNHLDPTAIQDLSRIVSTLIAQAVEQDHQHLLTDLGFASFTNTGRESLTISTLRLPEDLTVEELYEGCKKRGFVIYRCKGVLAARHVQIANMGELSDGHIDAFLAALTAVVEERRRKPRPASVTAIR